MYVYCINPNADAQYLSVFNPTAIDRNLYPQKFIYTGAEAKAVPDSKIFVSRTMKLPDFGKQARAKPHPVKCGGNLVKFMKKIQLKFAQQQLTKEEMKAVTGGVDPSLCGGTEFYADWYCGGDGTCTHLGYLSCTMAASFCSHPLLTTNSDCAYMNVQQ